MKSDPIIVFFGAGAVGSTVGGWVARHYDSVYFLDTGKVAEALKVRGLTLYKEGMPDSRTIATVKVVSDLAEVAPDVVVVAVKNYSLDGVARAIRDKLGDAPLIVALQNGVENQTILPRYFNRVVYGIIGYNAW